MNQKKYKLQAPIGNVNIPKEIMTEIELREFMSQLIQDSSLARTWEAKVKNDSIESIVEWLRMAGYIITEQ